MKLHPCIQETVLSRTPLAFRPRVCARVVYKIPYRRAPCLSLYTRYPIVARALGRVRRASKGILHTMLGLPLGRVRRASKGILHTSARVKVSCISYKFYPNMNSGGKFDLMLYIVMYVT